MVSPFYNRVPAFVWYDLSAMFPGCLLFSTDCVDYLLEWMYEPRDVMSEWTIYWNE